MELSNLVSQRAIMSNRLMEFYGSIRGILILSLAHKLFKFPVKKFKTVHGVRSWIYLNITWKKQKNLKKRSPVKGSASYAGHNKCKENNELYLIQNYPSKHYGENIIEKHYSCTPFINFCRHLICIGRSSKSQNAARDSLDLNLIVKKHVWSILQPLKQKRHLRIQNRDKRIRIEIRRNTANTNGILLGSPTEAIAVWLRAYLPAEKINLLKVKNIKKLYHILSNPHNNRKITLISVDDKDNDKKRPLRSLIFHDLI